MRRELDSAPAEAGAVVLRPTTAADLDFVIGAEGQEENRRFVSRWSRSEHQAAIDGAGTEHWIVEAAADGSDVGYAILQGLGSVHRSLELRRLVVVRKGEGFGRAALRRIQERAFGELGAHRLWLDVFDYNDRAWRLYESEGFVLEGTMRECAFVDGAFRSMLLMSMLEQEFRRLRLPTA